MQKNTATISSQRLNEFFYERILAEQKHHAPPFTDDTVSYLVNLLVYFSTSRNFFVHTQQGIDVPTLAFLYKDVQESVTTSHRLLSLHKLGDSALLIGAIFPEKLAKAGINKDYYIGMGGSAYSSLAEYNYGNRSLFEELSARFPRLLQVVARACSRSLNFTAEEVFALYQQWQKTGDALTKQQLMAMGITSFDNQMAH